MYHFIFRAALVGLILIPAAAGQAEDDGPVIAAFTAGMDRVETAAVEAGTARIPVSWVVLNRPPGTNLYFEQRLADGSTVNVELPRYFQWVPSVGDGVAAPVLTEMDAVVLEMKLVEVDTGEVLEVATVSIPYASGSGASTPQILAFSGWRLIVGENELKAGAARIMVSWRVANRPPDSNLFFEQVLLSPLPGSTVNVELPRDDPWVPSSGRGVVAPIYPEGEATGRVLIRLRLRALNPDAVDYDWPFERGVYDERTFSIQIISASEALAIVSFTTSASAVDPDRLAHRIERVPVTWVVEGPPPNANLVFEQVMPDGRILNVELPRDNPWVSSTGDGIVMPYAPGEGADEIVLQVRMVDMNSRKEYAKTELALPIRVTGAQPHIAGFETSVASVPSEELRAGTARIPVTWTVENRPDNSNLVFEQVMRGGQIINVELPRDNLWVSSSGVGVMAPQYPGEGLDQMTFQLRLIDLSTEDTLDSRLFHLSITGYQDYDTPAVVEVSGDACYEAPFAPSHGLAEGEHAHIDDAMGVQAEPGLDGEWLDGLVDEPVTLLEGPFCYHYQNPRGQQHVREWKVSAGLRTLEGWVREYDVNGDAIVYHLRPLDDLPDTGSDGGPVEIVSFAIDKTDIAAGESITLSWEVKNASSVTIRESITAPDATDYVDEGLPRIDSRSYALPEYFDNTGTIFLDAYDQPDAPPADTAAIEVTVTCDKTFFFGAGQDCAVGTASEGSAVYQAFENGFMVWEASGHLYVLLDDGTAVVRGSDPWDDEPAAWDETPPDGLLLPTGSFGRLWAAEEEMRSALGWATAPAVDYTTQLQPGMVPNQSNPIQQVTCFSLPDGRIVRHLNPGGGDTSVWETAN